MHNGAQSDGALEERRTTHASGVRRRLCGERRRLRGPADGEPPGALRPPDAAQRGLVGQDGVADAHAHVAQHSRVCEGEEREGGRQEGGQAGVGALPPGAWRSHPASRPMQGCPTGAAPTHPSGRAASGRWAAWRPGGPWWRWRCPGCPRCSQSQWGSPAAQAGAGAGAGAGRERLEKCWEEWARAGRGPAQLMAGGGWCTCCRQPRWLAQGSMLGWRPSSHSFPPCGAWWRSRPRPQWCAA